MRIYLKEIFLDHETRFVIQHSQKKVIDLESSDEEELNIKLKEESEFNIKQEEVKHVETAPSDVPNILDFQKYKSIESL